MTVHYSNLTWHLALKMGARTPVRRCEVWQKQQHMENGEIKTRKPAQAAPHCRNVLWTLSMTVHYSNLTWHLALKMGARTPVARCEVWQKQQHMDNGEIKTRRPAQAAPYSRNVLWTLSMT